MDKKDILVVVLTRIHATGLSVLRSLGEAGYEVDVVASSAKAGKSEFVAKSRYVREYEEVITKKVETGGEVDLLAVLLKYASVTDKTLVLFPTDDYSASFMDNNRDVLGDIFIMPGIVDGKKGSLTEHMDKTYQSRIAAEAGLLVPKAWTISLREEDILIPDDMIYPCFCKPIESITGFKTEMARCDSEEELAVHLRKLRNRFADRDILVQEFLQIDNEINFGGACLDQEIIVPAIIRKIDVANYETGVAITGRMCPFEELGEMAPKLVKMLQAYRYQGLFDIDLNVVGDKIYYNETNMRSGGSNYAYYMSGVNLPELFVKHMTGQEISDDEKRVDEFGKKFIYETVAWDDYIFGYMTKEELDEKVANADITLLYNENDAEPGRLFDEYILKKKQRVDERRARNEERLQLVMEKTGWDRETAEADMGKAGIEGGVTYFDYVKYELWRVSEEKRPQMYERVRIGKERKRERRQEYIQTVMDATNSSYEKAEDMIQDAREKFGISYRDYAKNRLWTMTEKQQAEEVVKILERKEDRINRKDANIEKVALAAGWDIDEAREKMRDAKFDIGITYRDYAAYDFWKIPEEEQEAAFQRLKNRPSMKIKRVLRRIKRKFVKNNQ